MPFLVRDEAEVLSDVALLQALLQTGHAYAGCAIAHFGQFRFPQVCAVRYPPESARPHSRRARPDWNNLCESRASIGSTPVWIRPRRRSEWLSAPSRSRYKENDLENELAIRQGIPTHSQTRVPHTHPLPTPRQTPGTRNPDRGSNLEFWNRAPQAYPTVTGINPRLWGCDSRHEEPRCFAPAIALQRGHHAVEIHAMLLRDHNRGSSATRKIPPLRTARDGFPNSDC